MEGIVRNNGRPLMLSEIIDEVDPIVGYQVIHQRTKELLPDTYENELYKTPIDMVYKMQEVADSFEKYLDFDIFDYEIIDVRRSEVQGEYQIINYLI